MTAVHYLLMAQLPTGTVTFLFTDIEDSTGLVSALGDGYAEMLARHHSLLRGTFDRHDGVEVMTEGDAFFVVFRNATAALRAAVDAQRGLAEATWPGDVRVRVRIGLHTGEAVLGGDNYVGLDVHRAARISAAAHGGQVLVSDATRALVEQSLAKGVALKDLGRHRLRGLPEPEHIFQVLAGGLEAEFPPLASVDAQPNNLPRQPTSFVGRERDVAEVMARLAAVRLLTLTGPGGTGKSRLALRVAEQLLPAYEDGCWFVALDALRDADTVPATIATAMQAKLPPGKATLEALEGWLSQRQVLLVLDNFEQLLPAAPQVARLLDASPRSRILVTSRTPLGIYGEYEYPVPPLAGAAELRSAAADGAESLSQFDAVRLFIERALAVRPDFRVTNSNAPAVAEICARLDGLPLAIELAAARIKLLTPEQMLERLERSMSLLTSSATNLPPRQRTLHGAIDWSHDLLDEPEKRMFARLSVFRGGFSLQAAEATVIDEDLRLDALDGVASLVNQSLLQTTDSPTDARFVMLETIRQYARARLAESGEESQQLRRHAQFFFELATSAERELTGPEQVAWLDRLEQDHDNLRAAFERAPDIEMLDAALLAAGSMWRFWQLRARFAEGRAVFDRLLSAEGGSPAARAKALTGAGGIAYWQTDYELMGACYREARALYEQLDDVERLAEALYNEAYVPVFRGDMAGARPMLERSMDLHRQLGNDIGAAEAEWFLGFTYFFDGQPAEALAVSERAVAAYRAAGSQWHVADSLTGLAAVQASTGQWVDAVASMRESLAIFRQLSSGIGQTMVFEAMAIFAAWLGQSELAARMFGKSEQMKEEQGGSSPSQMFQTDRYRDMARSALGDDAFAPLLEEGGRMSADEAAGFVEAFDAPPDAPALPAPQGPGPANGDAGSE